MAVIAVTELRKDCAGKTTTVEILEGHRAPTSGHVTVLGFDPATGGRVRWEPRAGSRRPHATRRGA